MSETEPITSPPLTAENRPPTPPQSPSESHLIENELQDPFTNNQSDQQNHQETPKSQSLPPEISAPPHVYVPMSSLQDLAASLTAFQGCFSNLQHQFNSLKTAVDSLITIPPHINANISVSLPPPNESKPRSPPVETQPAGEINKTAGKLKEISPAIKTQPAGKINVKAGKKAKAWVSELEGLCRDRCSKGLRRFIGSNLKDSHRLREQVPKALKLVPNLAKFVLECAGKFFVMGSKAYANKDSPAVTGRKASVMILECYLLMRDGENGIEIETEKAVKEEADQSAVSWKKRMVSEGGVIKACEIDARGLLFWIGCFGVPATFKNEDVRDLLLASNPRVISGALRNSSALMTKVPDVIDWMKKNNMEIDAIDIAYIFGLENTIDPRTMLISFLQEGRKTWKNAKKASKGSPNAQHEAKKKKLAILKSVVKCVEGHKIDPKVLSEWQIREKISSIEKNIIEFNKRKGEEKAQKRKADEAESAKKLKPQEVKRPRYNGQGLLQHQIAAGHVDSQRHFLESGSPGHIINYCAPPSTFHAPAAGTAPYAGGYGGMLLESPGSFISHSAHPYEYRGDPALTERLVSHSYAGQPPSSSVNGLYRPSTSLDGYGMVPYTSSVGVPSRSAGPDLYQFADAVVENEYKPPLVSPHHKPYQF